MADLDLNGDGVIDFYEFTRWYFCGMKSYSDVQRSLLTFSNGVSTLQKAFDTPLSGDDLNVITQKFGISLNNPSNSSLDIGLKLRLAGPEYQKLLLEAKTLRMNKGMPITCPMYEQMGGEKIVIAKATIVTPNK